jgi:hypothetical protein
MNPYSDHFFTTLSPVTFAATSCIASKSTAAALGRLAYDFNAGPTWKTARPYASLKSIKVAAKWQNVGSYDVAGSAQ